MSGGLVGVRAAEIEGKGRGVVAARALRGGDVVAREWPILVYEASGTSKYCYHCLKTSVESCCKCSSVVCGCGPHSSWACHSLSLLRGSSLYSDHLLQARFLIAAYDLARPQFGALLSLQGSPDASTDEAAREIHGVLGSLGDQSSALLAKDKVNAFGLMMDDGSSSLRGVRGYAIYRSASLFNHDCLPNACRFDSMELNGSTEMVVRMIHDVPAGSEICLSYFPVNLDFKARQARLLDGYGFRCTCDRCKVEAEWDLEEEEEHDSMMEEAEEEIDNLMEEDDDDDNSASFPHAYFFGRYMCQRDNCGGTLAPLPPASSEVNAKLVTMECNVCANMTPLETK